MKTRIKFVSKDYSYDEWELGDTGFVDSYVQNYDNLPFAVVVLDKNNKFVLCSIKQIELIRESTNINK